MKRAIQVVVAAAAVLVLIAISLPLLVNANQFRPRLQSALAASLNRQVTVGDLSFSIFSGKVSARDLSIAEDPRFGAGPFVSAKSLDLGIEVWRLIFSRTLIVKNLTITEPAINLVQNQAGQWNFSSMGAKSDPSGTPSMDLSAKLVRVADGRVSLAETGGAQKPMVLENVNISLTGFAHDARFPFSFTGRIAPAADVKLDGTAGPINASDASLTPVQLSLKISGLDLLASGVTANSGVAGILAMDGSGNTSGTSLDWKGTVRIEKAKFVAQGAPAKQPVQLDFAGQHNLQNHSGSISQGDLRFGNAAASLTGGYMQQGSAMNLNFRLAGSAMPVNTLVGLLPALDVQLPAGSTLQGGNASVNAAITGSSASPIVAGTVAVNGTSLKGFDLASKVGALEKLAGVQQSPATEIQTLGATIRWDANGTTIPNLKLVAPALGEINGTGTINARHDLDFKMVATINTHGLFTAAFGGKSSAMPIPFFVKGTSTNPVFEPDVAGIAAAEVKRLTNGTKIGGVDAGQAINVLQGLFGGKKK